MANPTVWTSSIQNVNIDQLRRELEAYPGIDPGDVLSIEPKNPPTDTTVTIAVDFGTAGDTNYDNVQSIIDSHVDNQTENLNLIGRDNSIFGNKELGQISFQNNDIFVWRIDSNNDLLPVQSGLDFGNSLNRINKIWAVTGSYSGDLTVDGNLTVNGTLTWVNTTNLEVSDNIVLINSDWTGSPTEDAGIEVERDTEDNARLNWNETDNWWEAGDVGDLQKIIRETEFQNHVTDTANPHSVTKSQVGLGNVTNDAQLKRANGDFDTFFEKTVPVAADIFLIEDSASSFAKNKLTFANLEANLDHDNLIGSGANTHAQIDSHISSTSNPHSVTASQVGLGNVTNDAQLLRSANDFTSFTEKLAPVNADILLIEDSEDAGNKKYIQLSTLGIGVQANDSWIQWRNFDDDADLNVLKVDVSDNTVLQGENEIHLLLNTVNTTDTGAIHISASSAIPGDNNRGAFISLYGEDYPDLDLRGSVNIGVGSETGSGGVQGKAIRLYNSTFDAYHWLFDTNSGAITHTNYDVKLTSTLSTTRQALGQESTSAGGWITTYNNSHSTHPGKVILTTGRFANNRNIEFHTGIETSSPQTYHRFTIPSTLSTANISELLFERNKTYLHPNTLALSDIAEVVIGAFGRNGFDEPTGSDRGSLIRFYGIDHASAGNIELIAGDSAGQVEVHTNALHQWTFQDDGALVPEQSNDIGTALKPVDTIYANNIVGTTGGIAWQSISSNTAASADTGYVVIGSSGQVELSLPVTSDVGDVIEITSADANGWRITQGASQRIRFASVESTIGAGGYIQATQQGDGVKLVCVVANFKWNVVSSIGNIEIV